MSTGVKSWAAAAWRPLLGEVLATALLLLLGCMTLFPDKNVDGLTRAALGFGGAILGLVQVFGPISGAHMNPAVTLAAVVARKLDLALAAGYVVAQVVGALLGILVLSATSPATTSVGVAVTVPNVTPLQAVLVEAGMTGLLALLCCAAWQKHDDTMPIKFGLLIAGLVYSGGPLTGTSLNPARSLAPAIWNNSWEHHWVYWVGPLLGAGVCSFVYGLLVPPQPRPSALRPEDIPLRDKTGEP